MTGPRVEEDPLRTKQLYDLYMAHQQVALYRIGFRELKLREAQLVAITLADELARVQQERGVDRLLTAVSTSGDFSECIAQMQAVVHRAAAVCRAATAESMQELCDAVDLLEIQCGGELP